MGLFSGSLFSEGLFIGRNFAFQNRLGLTIKQPKTLRNQPKTASTNSAWAYIWGAYFREGLFIYFVLRGGGGGGSLLSELYGIPLLPTL